MLSARHALVMLTVATAANAAAAAPSATKLWETAGFKNPESALFDSEAGIVYVSNVNGEPTAKDGNGFVSIVAPDGKVQKLDWVKGMNGPKGMARVGGKLYVADIDELVEIDIKSAIIAKRYPARGAKFLNDVAADAAGNIYVSDMATHTIWRLSGGTFEEFVKDAELESPNGLLVENDTLWVAAWGVMTNGMETKVPGHLKRVSLRDKSIASHGDGSPLGNLDGLEPLGGGSYLVSDWVAGKVFQITASGEANVLVDLGPGTADLGYDPRTATAFIPQMKTGVLYGFSVK